jgi:hypothetical protein
VERKIAEVVEASSSTFVGQCYELYETPPLGAFLRVGQPPTYGIVQNVVTGALDPGRRVMARGAEEESEEGVYRSNPQLARLLTTRLEALIVGYEAGEAVRHGLPPAPPRLHAFVYACGPQEVVEFTQTFDFLRLLVRSPAPMADEVIVACLRAAAGCHPEPRAFLTAAGRALALALASESGRLNAILRRLGA